MTGRINLKACLVVSMFLLVVVSSAAGKIIFVDADATGANNGSSWANAYNFLQDALNDAVSGEDVWVTSGTYKPDQEGGVTPGDRFATFQLINGVIIKGGYVGYGAADPNERDVELYETILSGDLNMPGDNSDNSYNVVTGSGTDETAVLDGFTITAGWADGLFVWPDGLFAPDKGGGMWIASGSPTVLNCIFSGNAAGVRGGGMYNDSSSPTLTDCTFTGNSTRQSGGGMYNDNNSNPILTNCIFIGNSANNGGGGMYNYKSTPVLTNCMFSENFADYYGGGVVNSQSDPTLTLTNCIFSRNTANNGKGGGMETRHTPSTSTPTVTNCIFWGNIDVDGIVESAQIHGNPIVPNYCCIQGWTGTSFGASGGTGNFGSDPGFVDAENGDYHLLASSPCIDAGDNTAVPADTADLDGDGNTTERIPFDLDGNERITNGTVDIGAYESPVAVVFAQSGGSTEVNEEGPTSNQYTVVLTTQPTMDVNICLLDLSEPSQVTVAPELLVFTPDDWNSPKTVTVTAIDDSLWETSPHYAAIGHTIATDDPVYQWLDVGNVTVLVNDNDEADVRIEPVVMLIDPATTSEVRTTLPHSMSAVVQGSIFYVEIWASDSGTENTGLTSVYVDALFCEQASALDLYHGTIFITFPDGTIQADGVDEFGGSAVPSGGGIEPEWVRIGWIKMSGALVENCTISLLPSFSGVAAFDRGLIPWDQIELGSIDLEITAAAKSYDLDGDDFIGPGDLSLFAGSWLETVPPADDEHDFDCDGLVGVGDLSWFATGWGKYTDDPTILYTACPGAGGGMMKLAGNDTTTGSALLYAAMTAPATDGLESSADIAFELVILDTQSLSDTTTTMPTSLNTIISGQTYYLELWASDVGGYDTGVTSAYVDVNFPADVVTIRNVSCAGIFTMFTDGSVVSGLIDELGGSTLSEGVAEEPQWARVAVVEIHTEAAPPSITFSLSTSRTGVSAYGRGQISWEDISLGSVTVNDYDINGDDKVNLIDFAILADQWGQARSGLSADIAPPGGDGIVNWLDLAALLDHWLAGIE